MTMTGLSQTEVDRIRNMGSPVRCPCGSIYDTATVELHLVGWWAPCCRRMVNDQNGGVDFYSIDRREVWSL